MTALVESPAWADTITQLETTDLVLGGADGPSNRALKELANRTRFLLARLDALTEQPLAALPYPTIATADNRLTVTPAASTAGGTVSIAAGTRITLSEAVESAATGRLRSFETPDYISADLVANSTYYLRAQVDSNGDLKLYTARGTDADPIPATKLGTPDAASGGGFDSTVLDLLAAKVVTGAPGTLPSVTALANAARMVFGQAVEMLDCGTGASNYSQPGWTALAAVALNWARAPSLAQVALAGFSDNNAGWEVNGTGVVSSAAVRVTAATRYALSGQYAIWDEDAMSNVSLRLNWMASA